MPMPIVTLYSRSGCQMCVEAESGLHEFAPRLGFDLRVIDIDSSDELLRRYVFAIPVVALDGTDLLAAPFSRAKLGATLEDALWVAQRKK